MKKVAVHSQKGGVGKTTISLLLAKYAVTQGLQPCVLDFDFIGSGMANLLALEKKPSKYVEDYFLHGRPHEYDVESLLGLYTDTQVRPKGIPVVLNTGRGLPRGEKAKQEIRLEDDMLGMAANEPHYQEIRTKTEVLLGLLEKRGFTMIVVDCHPGLSLVSETVRGLVDLNVYVTTPNRSDCFGLLREVNLRKLDSPQALLVVNRAEPPLMDLASLRQFLKNDKVLGPAGSGVQSILRYMATSEPHNAFLQEREELRRCFYLGTGGLLPPVDAQRRELDFCSKAMALLGKHD